MRVITFHYLLDRGHSFDALLLYGHEFSLSIFDVMVFSFVDLLTHDFLAAAITTFFVAKVRPTSSWQWPSPHSLWLR